VLRLEARLAVAQLLQLALVVRDERRLLGLEGSLRARATMFTSARSLPERTQLRARRVQQQAQRTVSFIS
jgi:hypothetical protein